jgi:DNA-binding transcriptional LysR family regulator
MTRARSALSLSSSASERPLHQADERSDDRCGHLKAHWLREAERGACQLLGVAVAVGEFGRQAAGVQLLGRNSRSVVLTQGGGRARALPIADRRRRQAAGAALDAQAGATGVLRIAAVTSAFTEVLPRALRAFRDQRPGVELRVSEIDTHHGARAVLDERVDVAVIRQSRVDPRLRSDPLRRDHLVAVVPTAHRLAAATPIVRPVDLAELADDPWVWLPREVSPAYHDEPVAACRATGFSPGVRHSATSIDSQLALVGCGLGVTLAPHTSTTSVPAGTFPCRCVNDSTSSSCPSSGAHTRPDRSSSTSCGARAGVSSST